MNMVQQFDPAQLDLSQDYGTPAINSEVEVTVHIDGMPVTVPEGTSVMRAAAIAGAVHNACGLRLGSLPLTPDKVLMGLEELRARG